MSSAAISLRAADASQFDAVVALLTNAGLPASDLSVPSLQNFLVASEAGRLIGAVAMERYGEVALLRSLVVAPDHRGSGVGAALADAIEQKARDEGVQLLVLLTETARDFFARRGYAVVVRADAPASVRKSSEFAFLCPASAVYMERSLR